MIYINDAAEEILGYSLADYLSYPRVRMKVIDDEHLKTWIGAVDEKKAQKMF